MIHKFNDFLIFVWHTFFVAFVCLKKVKKLSGRSAMSQRGSGEVYSARWKSQWQGTGEKRGEAEAIALAPDAQPPQPEGPSIRPQGPTLPEAKRRHEPTQRFSIGTSDDTAAIFQKPPGTSAGTGPS